MLIERMRKRLSADTGEHHRTLPPVPRRQASVRLQLDSRDQARWLSAHGPARFRRHPAHHPPGQRLDDRFPLVVEAVNHLKVRSCLIDGEVVCCDERGFGDSTLRRRRNEATAFLYAFDLLELDGLDLRREPIEVRKATWPASCARSAGDTAKRAPGAPEGAVVFQHACKLGLKGLSRSGWDRVTDRDARRTG